MRRLLRKARREARFRKINDRNFASFMQSLGVKFSDDGVICTGYSKGDK